MLNCLINNILGGGIPMGINCAPILVYLFSCRFQYADDDFVLKIADVKMKLSQYIFINIAFSSSSKCLSLSNSLAVHYNTHEG